MIENGVLYERRLEDDLLQEYFLYVPTDCKMGAKLLFSVHGLSRNAKDIAEHLVPFAEKYGVVLVVPLFSEERFSDYNIMGNTGKGYRPDHALQKIVAEVGNMTPADTEQIYLFGFSAGGQFVHRYALAYPERIAKMVVGASGWYTFPDPTVPYPRGILPASNMLDIPIKLDQFLHISTCILVGELDIQLTASLDQSPEINEQQGINRVERGRRWYFAIREAAGNRGLKTIYHYRTLRNSGHDFVQCMQNGDMGRFIFDFLFSNSAVITNMHQNVLKVK
ncbi:alpha/beta fold hydrolase [Brevibacillus panacihumi]|uniref:alpha/beta fold hydrolase n=1 Tax=Brevibacillus panacihumi TaxID=497735 RepID=UPI003D039AE9